LLKIRHPHHRRWIHETRLCSCRHRTSRCPGCRIRAAGRAECSSRRGDVSRTSPPSGRFILVRQPSGLVPERPGLLSRLDGGFAATRRHRYARHYRRGPGSRADSRRRDEGLRGSRPRESGERRVLRGAVSQCALSERDSAVRQFSGPPDPEAVGTTHAKGPRTRALWLWCGWWSGVAVTFLVVSHRGTVA
jgi:hypothetical protein